MVIILAAVVPSLLYLLFLWKMDRYDKEPFWLLLLNFLWGATGSIILITIPTIILESVYNTRTSQSEFITSVIMAPLFEETGKGIFLLFTVTRRKFDNLTDGIVYGGAIGLGFGMTENFLYFLSSPPEALWGTIFWRTFCSIIVHCVATGTFGAALGFAKYRSVYWKILLPPAGLLYGMLTHAFWNYSVITEGYLLLGILSFLLSVVIFLFMFFGSIRNESRIIYEELLEESGDGILPEEHVFILSNRIRDSKGWIAEHLRKDYLKHATTLAFRKAQLKKTTGINRMSYEADILFHREKIKEILKAAYPLKYNDAGDVVSIQT
ncbi:MAG: PrsW family intramembrane metalloprotease [Ignavibacteriaceae bacterium]|nr:PrsW family intramembrane metalloprotease [Ignavibacteriaceae bacterium]